MQKIEIFTAPKCMFCEQAKMLMDDYHLKYIEYNVAQTEHMQALLQRIEKASAFPQIFLDGEHIGNDEALAYAIADGRVQT